MVNASPDIGLYFHWPYCKRICPYCDFNVYKDRAIDVDGWITALDRDLDHARTLTQPRALTSIYFGGGTPSLCPPDILTAVINKCRDDWGIDPNTEITLEANPADLTAATMRKLADLGVNRLSLGVQSFDDAILKRLGRDHDGQTARAAIANAQEIFETVTFDLIYGVPGQSIDAWQEQLDIAIIFGTDHLSLYQLTIEPGTAFAKQQERGTLTMADDDDLAVRYEMAIAAMNAAGLAHYEISNFAKPGRLAQHNLLYWRYQDYIGIGPGAHGRLSQLNNDGQVTRIATQARARPADYLSACEKAGHGLIETEELTREAQMQERFSMGLRLAGGIDLGEEDYFFDDPARSARLQDLIVDGLLIYETTKLRATPRGRQLLNWVVGRLLV